MQFWSVYVYLFSHQHLKIYWVYSSDIDECNAANNSCHENAWCNNTQGSFNCSCKPGYEGDGYNCTGKILWVFSNPFNTICLSLRGDWWQALKSVRERECVLTVTDYMIILYWWLYWLPVCSGRMNWIFTLIITQTQTNAWTTLTIVAKMPPAPTSKGPSTVVANQGTLEMATTVQVGSRNSCLAFR